MSDQPGRRFETLAVHAGFEPDPTTGAVVPAIQPSATFQQDAVGQPRNGYEYARTGNPTRETLEYLRQDPLGYFGSYLPLAAYTLGVGSALNDLLDERPVQLQPELLALEKNR